ncbi:hypothetical protein HK102_012012, partial [Quaeritorhiza haematococci]
LADQVQEPAAEGPRPADRRLIGGVGPDPSQSWEPALDPLAHQLALVAVLHARRVDHHRHEQPRRVDDGVALAARRPLPRVVVPLLVRGGADRLAVDDRGRRALPAAVGPSQAGAQHLQHPPPGAVEPPAPVVGQHPPGDVAADDVEDAVEDLAEVDRPGPAAQLRPRQERADQVPLLVRHVGGATQGVLPNHFESSKIGILLNSSTGNLRVVERNTGFPTQRAYEPSMQTDQEDTYPR